VAIEDGITNVATGETGRGRIDAEPKSLLTETIGPNEVHLYRSRDHKGDFVDCVRTRRDPIASVEVGHRSATLCHLANIALWLGRPLRWNPDEEHSVDDPGADRMMQ